MNDVVFLAQFKRFADVDAKANHVAPCERVRVGIGEQRREQLHADQNIPSDSLRVTDDLVILVADNVCGAFQPGHNSEFAHHVLHNAVEIFFRLSGCHPFLKCRFQLRLTLRHGNDLERRAVGFAEIFAPKFKHLTEAALSQLMMDGPVSKDNRAGLHPFLHGFPSFLRFTRFLFPPLPPRLRTVCRRDSQNPFPPHTFPPSCWSQSRKDCCHSPTM